jgi:hypothetical protein
MLSVFDLDKTPEEEFPFASQVRVEIAETAGLRKMHRF